MLPRRSGARFALEALFLVALALGAGLADLRRLIIVIVMAGGWALVALAELSAARIDRSPVSYLPATPADDEEAEPHEVFGPRPEERTIVAPLERGVEAHEEEPAVAEEPPEAAEEQAPEEAPAAAEEPPEEAEAEAQEEPPEEPPVEAEAEAVPQPEPAAEPQPADLEPAGWDERVEDTPSPAEEEQAPQQRRRLGFLRRREAEVEPEPPAPPRHVKLLPRRPAEEPSRASQEVAELFGSTLAEDEPAQSEENRG